MCSTFNTDTEVNKRLAHVTFKQAKQTQDESNTSGFVPKATVTRIKYELTILS